MSKIASREYPREVPYTVVDVVFDLAVFMGWQRHYYRLWREQSTVHPFCHTSILYGSTCHPKHGPTPSADYSQPHADYLGTVCS